MGFIDCHYMSVSYFIKYTNTKTKVKFTLVLIQLIINKGIKISMKRKLKGIESDSAW